MQTVSETYKALWAARGTYTETVLVINGAEYGADRINMNTLTTTAELFSEQIVSAGGTCAREIDFTVRGSLRDIPPASKINVKSRLVGADGTTSEWIPKGEFFIDTRPYDPISGTTEVHGYDAILKMQQPMIPEGEPSGTWPKPSTELMAIIAARIGVEIDPRTQLNPAFMAGFPPVVTAGGNNDEGDEEEPEDENATTTMRKMAGWVAAMHCGNWIITDNGKLLLVPLRNISQQGHSLLLADITHYLVIGQNRIIIKRNPSEESGEAEFDTIDIQKSAKSMTVDRPFTYFSGIQYYYGDSNLYFSGDNTGRILEIECPWATQAIANAARDMIYKRVYQPYSADGALIDPTVELGDGVIVNGYESLIATMDSRFGSLFAANIGAPSDEEIDHEYPYEEDSLESTIREINKAKASIIVDLDKINLRVDNLEGDFSDITQTVDSIKLEVTQESGLDGKVYSRITLKIGPNSYSGLILMEGNIDVSGQLSADALYSALGVIADLSVNRLYTTNRITRYLTDDTSDDNYLKIEGEQMHFVSGVYNDGEEQALNPHGVPIWWEADVSHAEIGTDGYPYIDGVRVFTTTEETQWPVMVYTYTELIKGRYEFQRDSSGNYLPVMVFGAGNEAGNDQLTIRKGTSSAEILYSADEGKEIGMRMGLDGYLDLYGLRRLTEIDFSGIEGGSFTETLEGGIIYSYGVEMDEDGNIVRIYDDNHSVDVIW